MENKQLNQEKNTNLLKTMKKSMNKSSVFVEKAPLKKNYTLSTGTTGKML